MNHHDAVPVVQEVVWQDVRELVNNVDKTLTKLIDNLSPSRHFKLIKVRYSFGDLIINKGVLQLPLSKGVLLPINNPSIDQKIHTQLNYSSVPLFLSLEKSNEVFIDTTSHSIKMQLAPPGSLLGLSESTDYLFNQPSKSSYSISAGARSLFTLAKLNSSKGFKRLRLHYKIATHLETKSQADHWSLFKTIANQPHFEQAWHNEILFFTKPWLTQRDNDSNWVAFHRYLFKKAWA